MGSFAANGTYIEGGAFKRLGEEGFLPVYVMEGEQKCRPWIIVQLGKRRRNRQ